jgi:hypothetical protein
MAPVRSTPPSVGEIMPSPNQAPPSRARSQTLLSLKTLMIVFAPALRVGRK